MRLDEKTLHTKFQPSCSVITEGMDCKILKFHQKNAIFAKIILKVCHIKANSFEFFVHEIELQDYYSDRKSVFVC